MLLRYARGQKLMRINGGNQKRRRALYEFADPE